MHETAIAAAHPVAALRLRLKPIIIDDGFVFHGFTNE
jgi:hypothetical protein